MPTVRRAEITRGSKVVPPKLRPIAIDPRLLHARPARPQDLLTEQPFPVATTGRNYWAMLTGRSISAKAIAGCVANCRATLAAVAWLTGFTKSTRHIRWPRAGPSLSWLRTGPVTALDPRSGPVAFGRWPGRYRTMSAFTRSASTAGNTRWEPADGPSAAEVGPETAIAPVMSRTVHASRASVRPPPTRHDAHLYIRLTPSIDTAPDTEGSPGSATAAAHC